MIKHQSIIDEIKTQARTILTSNAYHTNIGEHVYINKANSIIKAADLNAVNIADVSMQVLTPKTGGVINFFDYALLVEATLHFKGGTSSEDIRAGVADFLKMIGENYTWNGLAINTYPPDGSDFIQFVYEQNENLIVGAKIYFIVEYRTTQWQEE